MRALIPVSFLLSMAASAADLRAVEVPPHFDFPEKARTCGDCGTVSAIEIHNRFDERPGKGVLMGSVVGAPAKAAAPGAYYRITIDMDDGKTRAINVENPSGLGLGGKVRVVDGNIEPTG